MCQIVRPVGTRRSYVAFMFRLGEKFVRLIIYVPYLNLSFEFMYVNTLRLFKILLSSVTPHICNLMNHLLTFRNFEEWYSETTNDWILLTPLHLAVFHHPKHPSIESYSL